MADHRSTDGARVALADGQSASAILHSVLQATAQQYPDLGDVPGLAQFRKGYDDAVCNFELNRLKSDKRLEIAWFACQAMRKHLVWQDDGQVIPLKEHVAQAATSLPMATHVGPRAGDANPGWPVSMVYRGQRWDAAQFATLGAEMAQRGIISRGAAEALNWLQQNLPGGQLDLRGRKVVVIGAGAEMASTRLWLRAGAQVLWLDVAPPPQEWLDDAELSGTLVWPTEATDLLTQPARIRATIEAFAADGAVDLALYAYAPGQAREVLLTGVMNEIVNSLPAPLIASVTLLVSPTTPSALDQGDFDFITQRIAQRPAWEKVLDGIGLLGGTPAYQGVPPVAVPRTVVQIQGASYQAAQYLGKLLIAECWASLGQLDATAAAPLRVSANTAAITKTRSLDHPVFAAAFGGAAAFGVETMTPRQSRTLNGLLAVHDWLQSEAPEPGTVRVHGGIHTLPYPLGTALRIAAAIGFARSPRLLGGLLGGK